MSEGYSRDRPPYLHGAGAGEQRRLEAQAELLGGDCFLPRVTSGMKVLDVGCGTGAIARRVAGRVEEGEIVGLDSEPEQIAAARKFAAESGVDVTFRMGRAEAIPYPDETFDASYCRFVLEHLADPAVALSEMVRVVRPGGWICALEWEPDSWVVHPASPNILDVWQAIYSFQASTGTDPRIGRKLYGLFQDLRLRDVRADTLTWSVTSGEAEALQMYVSGALEIVGQTRTNLVNGGHIKPESVDLALVEYRSLLASRATFIAHTFCRAIGTRVTS